MPRPKCCRNVDREPLTIRFVPETSRQKPAEEVVLSLDEFEAIRLADLEQLYQEHAADEMGISRQTFGRILTAAHNKLADALVHAKTLCIEGGHIIMTKQRTFICNDCRHSWNLACGTGRPEQCPVCSSAAINRLHEDGTVGCRGGEHKHEAAHGNEHTCCCKTEAQTA